MFIALIWPFDRPVLDAGFFLGLATTIFTILGIVLSLVLVGTQLLSSGTRVETRLFADLTSVVYLAIFVGIGIWLLAVAHFAALHTTGDGAQRRSAPLCLEVGGRVCVSPVVVGRASIALVGLLILLLVPFISYVYTLFRADRAYLELASRLATSSAWSDALDEFSRRLSRACLERDLELFDTGLRYLAAGSEPRIRDTENAAVAGASTFVLRLGRQLETLTYHTLEHPHFYALLCRFDAEFVRMILTTVPSDPSFNPEKDVRSTALRLLEVKVDVVHRWLVGEAPRGSGHESLGYIVQTAAYASNGVVRLNFAPVVTELTEILRRRPADRSDLLWNPVLRCVVEIGESAWCGSTQDIGRKEILRQLAAAVRNLAQRERRASIRHSTLSHIARLVRGSLLSANDESCGLSADIGAYLFHEELGKLVLSLSPDEFDLAERSGWFRWWQRVSSKAERGERHENAAIAAAEAGILAVQLNLPAAGVEMFEAGVHTLRRLNPVPASVGQALCRLQRDLTTSFGSVASGSKTLLLAEQAVTPGHVDHPHAGDADHLRAPHRQADTR